MGLFGFSSKKEVKEKEEAARAAGLQSGLQTGREQGAQAVINYQQSSLANLGKGSQIKFAVPYFDVFDPRFSDFAVPVAVHGSMVYSIDNLDEFNRLNKSGSYNDATFEANLKSQLAKFTKAVVANAPSQYQIQVLKLETKIFEISSLVQQMVTPQIEKTFGINVRSLDISSIMIDKTSRGYRELKSVTTDLERESITTQHNIGMSNMQFQNDLQQDQMRRMQEMNLGGQEEMQRMQLEHQRETMRIQREELQRASRLQTETNFLSAHQANLNADVARTGSIFGQAQPAAPQMPGMFGNVPPMPGSMPMVQYMVGINGQQAGPFDWAQLQQLVQQGQLNHQTYVWKQGMAQWQAAGEVQELTPLFSGMPPVMPRM